MGTLSYTTAMSLDGYVADADGDFQWSAPNEEVFQVHIDRMRDVSTEVLGRKTYQLMTYWEVEPDDGEWSEAEREFARRWQALDRVVVSSTLTRADLGREQTRLVADLDLAELAQLVRDARGEVEIFGPTTAAAAIRAGMVQDFRFFIVPKIVGGGLRALPDGPDLDLTLVEHRVFDDGTVYVHYQARPQHAGELEVTLTGQLVCANPEEADIVRAHLPRHLELTRAEPGCISFEVRETGNPLVWQVDERFRDDAAFTAHQGRVAASEWGRATAGIERSYVVERVRG